MKRKSKCFNQPKTSKEQSKIYLSKVALCSIYVSVGCFSRDKQVGPATVPNRGKNMKTLSSCTADSS